MPRLFLIILLSFSLHLDAQQVMTKPDEAFALSKQSGKAVLLIFSGSDWCIPCIQFNKKILSDSSFLQFAKSTIVILDADFPQRKKIAPDLKVAYEALAEKYNPGGEFPKIVMLDKEAKLTAEISFIKQTASEFITEIQEKLPK